MDGSRDIMSGLANKQVAGMMRHSTWADWMWLAGLRGFAMMQEQRFRDESADMREIRRWCIVELGVVPWNVYIETDYALPSEYLALGAGQRASLDDSTAQEDVRTVMNDWCRWEREVHDAYEAALEELEDPLCIQKVSDMMQSQMRELEIAEGLRAKLEAVCYDMDAICEVQGDLWAIYGKED